MMQMYRAVLIDLLTKSDQPLSSAELRVRANKQLNKTIDTPRINDILRSLVRSKQVSARVETVEERFIRAGVGGNTRGMLARLYSTQPVVPKRTKALDDIKLGDGQSIEPNNQAAARRYYKKTRRSQPVASSRAMTEVERVINERNVLRSRVAQLEKILKQAQAVINS